ncbi:hypothetical protein V6N13_131976 [Hibiscus sabdariffa]
MAFCNFNEQQKIVMMVTFWVVWYSRNKLVHERILPSVPDSLSFIQAFIRECGSPISLVAVEPTLPCSKWSAPALNIVKNNFDAAFDVQLIFAIELGFRNVVFEDDSLAVIKRVTMLLMLSLALAREGRGFRLPRLWIEEAPPGATSTAALDWEKLNDDYTFSVPAWLYAALFWCVHISGSCLDFLSFCRKNELPTAISVPMLGPDTDEGSTTFKYVLQPGKLSIVSMAVSARASTCEGGEHVKLLLAAVLSSASGSGSEEPKPVTTSGSTTIGGSGSA